MLQRHDTIVSEDHRVTTRQLALSLSITKASVTDIVRNLGYWKSCLIWVPRSFAVKHEIEEKQFISSCWHVLQLKEKYSCLGFLHQVKPVSIVLYRRQKVLHNMVPTTVSLEEKNSKTLRQPVTLSLFRDCEGVIIVHAMPAGRQFQRLHKDGEITLEAFLTSLASQGSSRNLAFSLKGQGRTQV
jgi:hypothetical protein